MRGRMASTPASATFCFSPPDRWKVSRSRSAADVQVVQRLLGALADLVARQAQVLQPEGHLVQHARAQDLPLRVLQHRADHLRDARQRQPGGVLPEQLDAALQLALVASAGSTR